MPISSLSLLTATRRMPLRRFAAATAAAIIFIFIYLFRLVYDAARYHY